MNAEEYWRFTVLTSPNSWSMHQNGYGGSVTSKCLFLKTLQSRVIVIPAWHATHPDHGALRRLISTGIYPGPRDLFTTELLDATRAMLTASLFLKTPMNA